MLKFLMVNNRLITSFFLKQLSPLCYFFLERPVSPLSQSFMLDLSSKTKLPTAAWAWAINQEAGMAFCSSYTPLKQSVIIKTVQVRTKSVSFLVNGDSLNKTEDFNNWISTTTTTDNIVFTSLLSFFFRDFSVSPGRFVCTQLYCQFCTYFGS